MKKIKGISKSVIMVATTIIMVLMVLFTPAQKVNAASKKIGTTKAISVALKDAKITKKALSKYKCKVDNEDKEYEVELRNSIYQYEYEINMYSGKIKSMEYERRKKDRKTLKSKITVAKAKNIAIKDAGVKASKVKSLKVNLKKSGSYRYYKVKFRVGQYKYEYEINAFTKTINEKQYEVNK